jgi:hypothetical protein
MLNVIPAPVQKWLTLLLPPFAILICCLVMVPRQNKLRDTKKETRNVQADIQKYLTQLQAISTLPPSPKIASLPMTKKEQSDFLRGLSTLCTRSGNRILTVTSLAAPPPPPPPPPGTPAPAPPTLKPGEVPLPPDVVAINSTIVFEGSFQSIRAFLGGLQRAQRMISLTDCRIGPGTGGFPILQTSLTVTRYVDAPPAGLPSSAPNPKTAATDSGSSS